MDVTAFSEVFFYGQGDGQVNVAISEFYEWGTRVPDAVHHRPADEGYPGGIYPLIL